MSHDPADTPVTKPVDEFTVAIVGALLLHVPAPPLRTTALAVKVVVPVIQRELKPVTEPILALGDIVIDRGIETVPPQPPVMV